MNLGVFKRRIDVDADIQMTPLKSLYASGDKDAHIFELSLYRGAEEVDLSGTSAQGYFIRADGYTVPITGTISGNVVTLTLSEGCYYVVGNFNLIIKISTAESRKSVFWGNGYVVRSMTDAIVDEENVIPSLDELLAQIAAAELAAKAANQAASAARSAASSAAQAASAANTNASKANSAANAAKAAATTATEAATKIDDMTITATGLAAGAAPTAALTEVDGHYNIVLGLPKGDKGDPGATPQITVKVKTGEPGTAASVKQTGTAEAPVIELTIPRGDTGSLGNLTINGKAPDAAGKVMLTAADVGAASADEVSQLKSDKLDKTATAADSVKLGGEAPEYYKTGLSVLWSNPSPSSTFAAQSIVLSDEVKNYTFLIIECGRATTNLSKIAGIFVVCYTSKQCLVFDEHWYRYVTKINGTNMTFGDSYDDSSSDNNKIVPTHVYGVKLGGA